jgi:hypothetical protein
MLLSNDVLRPLCPSPNPVLADILHNLLRPRDIEAIGLPREYLVRLHRQGKLNRPGRGIYTLPEANAMKRRGFGRPYCVSASRIGLPSDQRPV